MAQIFAFIIFGGLGAMLLVVGIRQWQQQRRSLAHAVPVEATIEHSQVFVSVSMDTDSELLRSNSTTSYEPNVRFSYVVAGKAYRSELLRPTEIVRGYASATAAERELAPFPLHAKVLAHVDPAHPEQAFLVAEASSAPMVFIVLGALLPPLAWFVGGYL